MEEKLFVCANWREISSIALFDKISDGYDAIVLLSVMNVIDYKGIKYKIDLKIERYEKPVETEEIDGITFTLTLQDPSPSEITFTEFKNLFKSTTAFFLSGGQKPLKPKRLFASIIDALLDSNPGKDCFVYKLKEPYRIRAQASYNRFGYGNIYYKDILVRQGILYGETGDYCISEMQFSKV